MTKKQKKNELLNSSNPNKIHFSMKTCIPVSIIQTCIVINQHSTIYIRSAKEA